MLQNGCRKFFLLCVLTCSAYVYCLKPIEIEKTAAVGVGAEFAKWLVEHDKSYGSQEEQQKREKIFKSNLQHINVLNFQYKTR